MAHEPQYGRRRKAALLAEAAGEDLRVTRGVRYFPFIVGAVAFLVYLRTMTPGMQMGDGTELATAAYVLGVPHPTGYPLYMMVAKFWLWITVAGDAIMRTTILNGFIMSAAVGISAVVFMDLLKSIWKTTTDKSLLIWAGAGALTLAFLRFHWGNAVVTEVYALQFLLMVVFTRVVQKIDSTGGLVGRSQLLGVTVCLALAFAHHRLSIAMLLPWAVLWVMAWRQRRRDRKDDSQRQRLPWVAAILILVTGASLYAYLPLRASVDPPVNWGNPDNASRFYNHVRGTEYLDRGLLKPAMGQSFSASTLALFVRLQTQHLFSDLASQFLPFPERLEPMPGGQKVFIKSPGYVLLLGIALGALALWGLLRGWLAGSRWTAFAIALIAVQNVGILYLYNIADIRDYFLYPFWAAWVGLFVLGAWAARYLAAERRLMLGYALLLILPVVVLAGNWQRNNRSEDVAAEILSVTILPDTTDVVPMDSILITDNDSETFTTWYRQKVRGERLDVFHFAGNFVYMPWYETFFTEEQLQEFQIKLAPAVARNAAEYAGQLREAVIDANIGRRSVFTSISDPAVLTVLAETYNVEPVDSTTAINRMFDEVVGTILYRISIKDQAQ